MANTNIVNVTSIFGKTVGVELTTSESTVISTTTDVIRKINSVVVANIVGSNDAVVTVYASIDSNFRYLAYQITVPAKSTLVVTSKDTSFYLEEADTLYALASANSDLNMIVSYEEIS